MEIYQLELKYIDNTNNCYSRTLSERFLSSEKTKVSNKFTSDFPKKGSSQLRNLHITCTYEDFTTKIFILNVDKNDLDIRIELAIPSYLHLLDLDTTGKYMEFYNKLKKVFL